MLAFDHPDNQRRVDRQSVDLSVELQHREGRQRVIAKDISRLGCRVTTSLPLEKGHPLSVRFVGFGSVDAYVAWFDQKDAGLHFSTQLPHELLDQMT